jgi:hypothetical protein
MGNLVLLLVLAAQPVSYNPVIARAGTEGDEWFSISLGLRNGWDITQELTGAPDVGCAGDPLCGTPLGGRINLGVEAQASFRVSQDTQVHLGLMTSKLPGLDAPSASLGVSHLFDFALITVAPSLGLHGGFKLAQGQLDPLQPGFYGAQGAVTLGVHIIPTFTVSLTPFESIYRAQSTRRAWGWVHGFSLALRYDVPLTPLFIEAYGGPAWVHGSDQPDRASWAIPPMAGIRFGI